MTSHVRLAIILWVIITGCGFASTWAFVGVGWAFVALGAPHLFVLVALAVKVAREEMKR